MQRAIWVGSSGKSVWMNSSSARQVWHEGVLFTQLRLDPSVCLSSCEAGRVHLHTGFPKGPLSSPQRATKSPFFLSLSQKTFLFNNKLEETGTQRLIQLETTSHFAHLEYMIWEQYHPLGYTLIFSRYLFWCAPRACWQIRCRPDLAWFQTGSRCDSEL